MDKFIKSIKKNTIFLLIITILVLFFLLKDNFISIYKNITNINVFWLFIALLCVLIYWICQSLCTHMIAKEYSKNLKFETIFKQNLITQFFNGITLLRPLDHFHRLIFVLFSIFIDVCFSDPPVLQFLTTGPGDLHRGLPGQLPLHLDRRRRSCLSPGPDQKYCEKDPCCQKHSNR